MPQDASTSASPSNIAHALGAFLARRALMVDNHGDGHGQEGSKVASDASLDALADLDAGERRVALSLAADAPVARNVAVAHTDRLTLGQRAADAVARFGGSWTFIGLFASVLVGWMAINSVALLGPKPFDPYPFILLNLVLSCLAAVQAPIIMMSQRRQDERDRLEAQNDYSVNLKAELEVREMREALDRLHVEHGAMLGDLRAGMAELRQAVLEGRAADDHAPGGRRGDDR